MAETRTDVMYARLFGRFEITDGEKTLREEDIRSDMVTKLAAFLISRSHASNTFSETVDALWPNDESDNPKGALKNLIYRMRKKFAEVWPDKVFFLTGNGLYRWNPAIPLVIDTEELVSCVKSARSAATDSERRVFLRRLPEIYRGRMLEDYSGEYWVIPRQTYYHNMWLQAVHYYADILEREQDYYEMETCCQQAMMIDPHDEKVHIGLLKAFLGGNKLSAAEKQYRDTLNILYDTLGEKPSAEFQQIYERMMTQKHGEEKDLAKIQRALTEDQEVKGAFYCEYGTFRKIYELEARRQKRVDQPTEIALLSLIPDGAGDVNRCGALAQIAADMETLKEKLLLSLRTGDVVTRYSGSQYLIMLPGCSEKDAAAIMERVLRLYDTSSGKKKTRIQYSLKRLM